MGATPAPSRNAPSRVIALEGASNLRDLGGWRTQQGRHTRFGKIFRSAKLSKLTRADVVRFSELGIRNICDLRGVQESQHEASVPLDGTRSHLLPMEAHLDGLLQGILAQREVERSDLEGFINTAYETYPHACAEQLRSLFALILEDGNLPLLFHCAAGKDRTGFAAAVLLTAVGVGWESVLSDYLATNQHWRRDFKLPKGMSEQVGAPLFAANEGMLASSFKSIETRYGSFDAYVSDVLGIDAAARRELEHLLTE